MLSLFVLHTGLASATTVTNVNISAYYTNSWLAQQNGNLIAAASTSGNSNSGMTFSNYAGDYVEIGPNGGFTGGSASFSFSPVMLTTNANVNTLMNTFWGLPGAVTGIFTFTNSLGETATYETVGNQTSRDYNLADVSNNMLQGSNSNLSYGVVTARNWWLNSTTNDALDAQTFVLPSSWAGTSLVSLTAVASELAGQRNDLIISAMQVVNSGNASVNPVPVPAPYAAALLALGLCLLIVQKRDRLKS